MPYDINEIRNNIRKAVSGRQADPDEFKPPKAASQTEPLKFRFFILPPVSVGDKLKSGPVAKGMDNYFVPHGQHWVNNQPHACPRLYDGSECQMCSFGFDLLKKLKDDKSESAKVKRKEISDMWMPAQYYLVNIYFPHSKVNPEDLRGKVKFFNASKTIVDMFNTALMRDDKGDEEDPQAWGVFFNEASAFPFDLSIIKDGRNNGYKKSQFVVNNGIPIPMIMKEDRTADLPKLEELLLRRHNLYSKIAQPEPDKIKKIFNSIMSGDDEDSGKSSGFTHDEYEAPVSKQSKKKEDPSSAPLPDDLYVESKETTEEPEIKVEKSNKQATKKPNPPPAPSQSEPDDDDDDILSLMSQLSDD